LAQDSAGHGEKRSRREDAALAALLACPTIELAAEQAGVAGSTLRGWLRDPAFQQRYRAARGQVLTQAVSALQQAAGKAVTVLATIAEDIAAPPAARVSAAKAILDQAFRGTEVIDLAARIAQLEQAQNGGDAA
jgi:hypothetical protein